MGKATKATPARRHAHKALRLTAVYTPDDLGGYMAEILGATGLATQGTSIEDAREHLHEAVMLILEDAPDQLPGAPPSPEAVPPGALSEALYVLVPLRS